MPATNMSPELAKVLLQNVQAFEENAFSTRSGDGADRPHTPAIKCGTIKEESAEAELTGSNMMHDTNGGTTETKKLEIEPIDFDSLHNGEQPIENGGEQLPTNRLTKYEDFDIYELE